MIFGLVVILTFIFLSCFITSLITCLTCPTDFVPVQTRFPDEKTRTADFVIVTSLEKNSFIKVSRGIYFGFYWIQNCLR